MNNTIPQLGIAPEGFEVEDPIVTVNLKMPTSMRDAFKKAAKKNGGSMQSVMFLLAQDYIENCDHLKFRLVDARSRS